MLHYIWKSYARHWCPGMTKQTCNQHWIREQGVQVALFLWLIVALKMLTLARFLIWKPIVFPFFTISWEKELLKNIKSMLNSGMLYGFIVLRKKIGPYEWLLKNSYQWGKGHNVLRFVYQISILTLLLLGLSGSL